MAHQPINLAQEQSQITAHWSPRHILTANDSHSFKLATIQGEFIWHAHPNTDEVFYCVSGGPLLIDIATDPTSKHERDGYETVKLMPGDLFNVPQGYRHRPNTVNETGILMIEKVGTVNTGDETDSEVGKTRTVIVQEQ